VTTAPKLDPSRLRAGMRVAVAVSGGADSVALLRATVEAAPEIGLVVSVAHVHHGIRGAEADEDAAFVQALAERMGCAFHLHHVDTPAAAREHKQTIEEAARVLRYTWFRALLAEGQADAVATAHTLDDQAETVLIRLLRGAWIEGLGGIHPVIRSEPERRTGATPECGLILRPFLGVRRAEIEAWLRALGQAWREDATNAETTFTRNRIRHELLPRLGEFNPRIAEQLAHMAELARDEEAWWNEELRRLLPQLLLPGRPVRGGGRAVSTHPEERSVGMELERLRALPAALRRRVLRAAVEQLGCALNFEQTERLMTMVSAEAIAAGAKKQELTADLRAERTARELRIMTTPSSRPDGDSGRGAASEGKAESFLLPIPGEVTGLGVTLIAKPLASSSFEEGGERLPAAILRTPKPGDRVQIKHSRGPKPLKEIFERMGVSAEERKTWPVVEWQGRIVWMRGVALEGESTVLAIDIASDN
jgi:tRNA(Ile)-lysidine synthase